MLVQQQMIERVRRLCQEDERLVAAAMYGSFAVGEGDAYSDVEFALFFRDECLAGVGRSAWVGQIAPVEAFFADDFGHCTAIFANLVRGEFHFEPASALPKVDTWQGSAYFAAAADCVLLDRSGELTRRLQPLLGPPPERLTDERVQSLGANLANVVLFGANVLARGERARALELLGIAHRYLLWLARLAEGSTAHWPTPSRAAEHDLSPQAYARLVACSAGLDAAALWRAYRGAWEWGWELMAGLEPEHGCGVPRALAAAIGERVDALCRAGGPGGDRAAAGEGSGMIGE
jgi:lincosamide nucleotidyltransferase B/F